MIFTPVFLLLALLIGVESGFAEDQLDMPETEVVSRKESKTILDLGISFGYRIDDLDWSIAGGGVNILSELTWEDLRIYQVKAEGRLSVPFYNRPFAIYVRSAFSYGKMIDGDNQDSDYTGNNRTLEFSRSNNDANDGTVLDGSIGVGLQSKRKWIRNQWMLRAAPLIGYSYHQQNLEMTNGFQTIPLLGLFPGLNSSYDAEWSGPWVGLDLMIDDGKKNTLFASMEYHWDTTYTAEADWNLRPDFVHPVSFKHEADGEGLVGTAGWTYQIWKNLSIHATLEYQIWTTEAGVDTTFLSQQEITRLAAEEGIITNGSIKTRLNQVTWETRAFNLGFQYHF